MNGKADFLLKQISPEKCGQPYWHSRIWAELRFLSDLSDIENDRFDELLLSVTKDVYNAFKTEGYISKEKCLEAEEKLGPAKNACKEYRVICTSHAHIDMNWMWAFDETVNVVLNTFRTMLQLMEEYPDFTFAQSQASCYRIVEEYGDEEMLNAIRRRVKEGRWEVTASTWVEADKNMPSLESMAKHALYTKNYLSKLLDIPKESIEIDFEPDTFGHSLNLPEILSKAGVKYYYRHRGSDIEECLLRWVAPSGKSILEYCDVIGYNSVIDCNAFRGIMNICKYTGQKTMLKLVGVGDHGGGPSRRDITRLHDFAGWPIFPKVKFGTYKEFFETVEKNATNIKTIECHEHNPIFTGCYTTQTRIKQANRTGERILGESEKFCAFEALQNGTKYPAEKLGKAWEKVLFSQFHDILTGSGVNLTREYALGTFQEAMAFGNTQRYNALRRIGASINTEGLLPKEDLSNDTADGAGVGYGVQQNWKAPSIVRSNHFGLNNTSVIGGVNRLFTVYNSAPFERDEIAEITVWDWSQNDVAGLKFTDVDGTVLPHQIITCGVYPYWGHEYVTVAVKVKVPAMGYTVIKMTLEENDLNQHPYSYISLDTRVHYEDVYVLENELVKIELDNVNGRVVSYYDKELGIEYCDNERKGGVFRFITEDIDKGMSAWTVGRYKNIKELTENVRIRPLPQGDLRKQVQLQIPITDISSMLVTLSLDKGSKALTYSCEVDWHEIGRDKPESGIYQLNFSLPLAYNCEEYMYQIPGGSIIRKKDDIDLPSIGYVCAINGEPKNGGIMVTTDSKYGFRGVDNRINVTLIRSAFSPDPYPENGVFNFRITVCPAEKFCKREMQNQNYTINNPLLALDQGIHSGNLPVEHSFMSISKCSAVVEAVKMDEKTGKKLIVRLNESAGKEKECVLTFDRPVKSAQFVDLCEEPLDGKITVEDNSVKLVPEKFTVNSIEVEF